MTTEAVLLTGGGSSRMGLDKSKLEVGGVPLGKKTAIALKAFAEPVTVLGREPIADCLFLMDQEEQAGPLSALSHFSPQADLVFVASCDMPRFHPAIAQVLLEALTPEFDAAVPVRAGIRQPTCALYRRRAFDRIHEAMHASRRSLMAWLDLLKVESVDEAKFRESGLDPIGFASFNTPQEFAAIEAAWAELNAAPEPPPTPPK